MTKQLGFYLDMNACTGCKTCMIACIDKNDLPAGVQFRRVSEYVGGDWMVEGKTFTQSVFAYNLSIACNHCEDPACAKACPTTAMHKEDGIVFVDESKCIGCRYCEWVCPYSAPQFDEDKGKMSKCDFCRDYLALGMDPACVASCPTRALKFGEYEELKKKYGENMVAPLPAASVTKPNLVLTPHRNGRPVGSTEGKVANQEEV